MTLSGGERRALEEIARRTAADDPDYVRRLSGRDGAALGPPAHRALLPVVLVFALMVLGLLAVTLAVAWTAENARSDERSGRIQSQR
ncbi:DUF3040 domain-containing protein [Spirillospora sp. CA-294931]|uniref:DUF3040 domain-containing protein n=1 Tax=Spirillospora sp. CA-294931 TaxID=3240042 RepID=UPI003D933C87